MIKPGVDSGLDIIFQNYAYMHGFAPCTDNLHTGHLSLAVDYKLYQMQAIVKCPTRRFGHARLYSKSVNTKIFTC